MSSVPLLPFLPPASFRRLARQGAGALRRQHLDLTAELAAGGDLDLGIADLARDLAGRLDAEALLDGERALEAAADLGILDRGRALVEAALGDLDMMAIGEVRLDAALDDEMVAGFDLAREGDLAADDEGAVLRLAAARRRRRLAAKT